MSVMPVCEFTRLLRFVDTVFYYFVANVFLGMRRDRRFLGVLWCSRLLFSYTDSWEVEGHPASNNMWVVLYCRLYLIWIFTLVL